MIIGLGRCGQKLSGVEYCNLVLRQRLDERGLSNRWIELSASESASRGRFAWTSFRVAAKGFCQLATTLVRSPRSTVYIPLSQGGIGLIRDSIVIQLLRLCWPARVVLHLHGEFRAELVSTWYGRKIRSAAYRSAARNADEVVSCIDGHIFARRRTRYVSNLGLIRNIRDDMADAGIEIGSATARDAVAKRRIGYLGLVAPGKGVARLIDSLPDHAELRLVGPVADRPDLMAAGLSWSPIDASSRGKADVTLLGQRQGADKWREMQSWDVACFPSRSEGLPLALLEARILGIAVVATDVGDIPKVAASDPGIVLCHDTSRETLRNALVQGTVCARQAGHPSWHVLSSTNYADDVIDVILQVGQRSVQDGGSGGAPT